MSDKAALLDHLQPLYTQAWVVYAKPPFGGPQQVLNYLGQYTHRIAISNHRLLSIDDGKVSFLYKDYADHNAKKVMTLSADEFIRRFLLHVLPPGFQRIRYYGFLANCHRAEKLSLVRQLLNVKTDINHAASLKASDWKSIYLKLTGQSIDTCPVCHHGRMRLKEVFWPFIRAPT